MPLLVTAWLAFVTLIQAPPPAPSEGDARAQAAALIAALSARDFAKVEAQFDEKMKAALPPGRVAGTWDGLVTQLGEVKACGGDVRVRSIADKVMVITPCEFARAKMDVQFAFDPTRRVSGFVIRPVAAPYAPPAYVTPSAYAESEVTVGSGEWALPGTLTLPVGAGPFPAVVLVHGSGPGDRDQSNGPNKMFRDLALGLASRGIAVLRYDKRSKVHGGKMAGSTGLTVREEVLEDAVAAAALARTLPRIDPARVFVAGHSLGGMLVPRIAALDPGLAGAISLAGCARPLERAILEQTTYLAHADGTVTPDEQKGIDDAQKLVESVAALKASDAAGSLRFLNVPASYWLDLRGYDPPAVAKGQRLPMLILQGERDYQVTMDDFARWQASLGGRRDVTFRSYAALNHQFMAGTGKSLPAEYLMASHVSEEVVNDIAAWIKR
jgi:dienelactone hydrolase